MYAAGRDHPLRVPCANVMERVNFGSVQGLISTEVIQEIRRLDPMDAAELER